MKSLIPIVEIANGVCEEVGDVTKKHQRIILRNMARCYQELHLFLSGTTSIKTESFPASNVIDMPADFVYETKVALMIEGKLILVNKNYDSNGGIIERKMNQSEFSNYVTDAHGMEIDESFTAFYNYRGEIVLKAMGGGGYCDGLYEVDTKTGRIYLGSNVPKGCEVVVEYKSDGVSNGLDLIPIEMESCLHNYGLWKYYFNRGDPRWRRSEEDYEFAYYKLQQLYQFKPINYLSKLYGSFEKETINDYI